MKKMSKSSRGITLVALVITIIVLLILAGITIASLTNAGLLERTKDAKEKTIKEQIKEEIEMTIEEIQIEEIAKGNNVTLQSLANGQLAAKLTDITAELGENEIIGEYKDYDYSIDVSLKVEIGEKITGAKPTGKAEILTTGYTFENNGTVQIKVTASISEGTITGIEVPEGATLATDISATEKTYTVSKNGIYVFIITGDSGRKKSVVANVENMLATPEITVDTITAEGFKINVNNNYPEGAIAEYKYYVGDDVKSQGTTNTSYTVTGLTEDTEYSNIKVIAYINSSTSKESNNIEKVSTIGAWSEVYQTTGNYTDAYGNVAKIPEGFQVSTKTGQKNINEGLVVRNATDKNEFVWIPTGIIYTNVERTESKTIELNRYTFDGNGNPTAQNDSAINSDYYNFQELTTSTYGNTTAKDINDFKTKASSTGSKGFYIGRYEARKSSSGAITEKGTDSVWTRIKQANAAIQARNMYQDATAFTSDLINSYAWDTATLFLQTCGTNAKYSQKTSVNSSLAKTGTNNQTTKDVQCNVYDIAGNCKEWTTETYRYSSQPCVFRGSSWYSSSYAYTSRREGTSSSNGTDDTYSFRPILYL